VGEVRNACEFLVRNAKGKDYLGDIGVDGDNIKMNIKEIWSESVDYIMFKVQ
jgi:hypothetical protein